MTETFINDLYANRRLAQGYPNLEKLAFESFSSHLSTQVCDRAGLDRQMLYLNRLVSLTEGSRIAVVGCGPRPWVVKEFLESGYDAVGIEPVPLFVESAQRHVGSVDRIQAGSAEQIPLPDNSQQLVYCNGVLEHVDSPMKSLDEMYRVLVPGGIAFIITTNRYQVSLTGNNGEYKVKFFNWLPENLKESIVFQHLHYDPTLANYSERPAVHWYTYAELCKLGRQAGFAQFYSPIDLVNPTDPTIANSAFKKFVLNRIKFSPVLRALVLSYTYWGGLIVMLKRK